MAEVRLIDANALKEKFIKIANSMTSSGSKTYAGAMEDAAKTVERQPTIEAEPMRYGRWVMSGPRYYCTSCSTGYKICNGGPNIVRFKRCPNCGAKMDEKE